MRTLIVNNNAPHIEKLLALIPGEKEVKSWNTSLLEGNGYDLIVLSGGHMKEVEAGGQDLDPELELIRNSKKPLIGICYGCELIVKAFGGSLEKMPQKEKGITEIKTVHKSVVFEEKPSFKIYENHGWRIAELPEDFITLAKSEHAIEMIKHTSRPIWGLQFHPENFVDESEGDELFTRLFKKISEEI